MLDLNSGQTASRQTFNFCCLTWKNRRIFSLSIFERHRDAEAFVVRHFRAILSDIEAYLRPSRQTSIHRLHDRESTKPHIWIYSVHFGRLFQIEKKPTDMYFPRPKFSRGKVRMVRSHGQENPCGCRLWAFWAARRRKSIVVGFGQFSVIEAVIGKEQTKKTWIVAYVVWTNDNFEWKVLETEKQQISKLYSMSFFIYWILKWLEV